MIADWVTAAGGVIGIVGILGGATAYFYAERTKAIIALQQTELQLTRDSLKERDGTILQLTKTVSDLQGQVSTLKDLVTHRPQFEALSREMTKHNQEMLSKLDAIETAISRRA